jgi:hypothetical protein
VNIENVYFQEAEYENALIQLNEGLDVFAAVMSMSRLEKANVFSFVVLLIFVICAVSLHTTTACRAASTVSLWSGPYTVM